MSQCRPGKHRTKVAIALAFILTLQVYGCSISELQEFATAVEPVPISQPPTGAAAAKPNNGYLVPESAIMGGQQKLSGVGGSFARMLAGPGDEIRFLEPVAVGGIDNLLYIVDAGMRIVYRYDITSKFLTPIGNVGSQFAGDMGKIFVNKDRSFYIVDSLGRKVFHFDENGLLLNTISDPANLSRPIDVWVDELSGEIYVADGAFSHIVIFNELGQAQRAIGRRGTGQGRFRAITGIGIGVDGLYVLDRIELPIQVLTKDGMFQYSFGEAHHIWPTAVVIDAYQRAYVSDRSDNTIRVYDNGQLVAVIGGGGAAKGRFRTITSMWLSGEFLYVADSQNRRVQILRIQPPANYSLPLG